MVDSVNWFGDACREKSMAASIVKYVTAIERLYMASADFGVKERFINRVSKILSDFELSNGDDARQDALRVYNFRSTLVHGGISLGQVITRYRQKKPKILRVAVFSARNNCTELSLKFSILGRRQSLKTQ